MHNTDDRHNNIRILIIDDNEAIHDDFRAVLGGNDDNINVHKEEAAIFGNDLKAADITFEIDSTFQGQEGLEKVRQSMLEGRPYTIAFVDIRMPPGWDGIETIQRIWKEYSNLQIVICTAYSDYSWHEMIAKLGEAEQLLILKKPFDNIEVRQMVCALAQKWKLLNNLDNLVKRRTKQIAETRDITVFALAKLVESRDPETGDHLERLRTYSQIIAEQLVNQSCYSDQIDKQFLENLYRSSPLHDIGKVGIPDAILLKPGKLTDSKFELMKRHSIIGEESIRAVAERTSSGSFLAMGAEIARSHHERFDGTGYPDGLKGQDIPLSARIIALADVYDALTSIRVYKAAIEPEKAKSMIEQESGKHFDPVIVEAFCARWDDFLKVSNMTENERLEPVGCTVCDEA